MYGFDRFPSPIERAALYQRVLNEHFPPPAIARRLRDVPFDRRIAVWVRIVWSSDGEEWLAGEAWRWDRRHVFVTQLGIEVRLQLSGVWVAPEDVRRRVIPQVSESG
ncbi:MULTISPECIES: hypothetical protein [Actinomycetes]